MNRIVLTFALLLSCSGASLAQSTSAQIAALLAQRLNQPEIVSYLLRQELWRMATPLPTPTSATKWTATEAKLRRHLIQDVVFHGWPKEWVDSAPNFQDMGALPSGEGYTRRKLRYEVVPGFWSTAILYEPSHLHGRAPAILNVTGHVGNEGKAIEYEQKRCINFALQGIVALNLEWIGQGELSAAGDQHFYAGDLDLVGANGVGLFYLEMRRGLDYLAKLPEVDPDRLGMTGLSGGGWQTMFLGALDERVKVAVPVAGYDSLADWIPRMPGAAGDNEQAATDVMAGQEYAILTAMRAPRPTLIILNAEDDCCFRAGIVRPFVYDAIKPFFALYGRANSLQFHENTDPSTHNYQLDNRQHAYQFFTHYFGLPVVTKEHPVASNILSFKDLQVGLPADNLTMLTLAQELAHQIRRSAVPRQGPALSAWASAERAELARVIRYTPVAVSRAEAVTTTKDKGVQSLGYRFKLSKSLPASGVWVKAITSPDDSPITIVLNDRGKRYSTDEVTDRVNRGDQVLALDLVFTGDSSTKGLPNLWAYPEMIASEGERPLGLEVAQLIALAQWIKRRAGDPSCRLETVGVRNQLVGLIASAIQPSLFSEVRIYSGMASLGYILNKPVHYEDAADIFCLDLYKDFDIESFIAMAAPTVVSYQSYAPGIPNPMAEASYHGSSVPDLEHMAGRLRTGGLESNLHGIRVVQSM